MSGTQNPRRHAAHKAPLQIGCRGALCASTDWCRCLIHHKLSPVGTTVTRIHTPPQRDDIEYDKCCHEDEKCHGNGSPPSPSDRALRCPLMKLPFLCISFHGIKYKATLQFYPARDMWMRRHATCRLIPTYTDSILSLATVAPPNAPVEPESRCALGLQGESRRVRTVILR